jgi:hypothetical protein
MVTAAVSPPHKGNFRTDICRADATTVVTPLPVTKKLYHEKPPEKGDKIDKIAAKYTRKNGMVQELTGINNKLLPP